MASTAPLPDFRSQFSKDIVCFTRPQFTGILTMKLPLLAVLAASGLASELSAGVVRSGFDSTSLGRNDDSSSIARSLEFSSAINFGGTSFTELYVNNNGNVTFASPLSAFTPFGLASLNRAVIAPFFADVDTRNAASGVTRYGTGFVDGHAAFGVTWKDVGYYNQKADKLNSFQLVLIDRKDTGVGNFDFEFNYDKIQWEAGDASRGASGLGGTTASIGFAFPKSGSVFQLGGSGTAGSFLDANSATGLIYNSKGGTNGRYLYQVRAGAVLDPTPIPEPASIVFGLALAGVCASGRMRRARR